MRVGVDVWRRWCGLDARLEMLAFIETAREYDMQQQAHPRDLKRDEVIVALCEVGDEGVVLAVEAYAIRNNFDLANYRPVQHGMNYPRQHVGYYIARTTENTKDTER